MRSRSGVVSSSITSSPSGTAVAGTCHFHTTGLIAKVMNTIGFSYTTNPTGSTITLTLDLPSIDSNIVLPPGTNPNLLHSLSWQTFKSSNFFDNYTATINSTSIVITLNRTTGTTLPTTEHKFSFEYSYIFNING
jgi:hypothetical protein